MFTIEVHRSVLIFQGLKPYALVSRITKKSLQLIDERKKGLIDPNSQAA